MLSRYSSSEKAIAPITRISRYALELIPSRSVPHRKCLVTQDVDVVGRPVVVGRGDAPLQAVIVRHAPAGTARQGRPDDEPRPSALVTTAPEHSMRHDQFLSAGSVAQR